MDKKAEVFIDGFHNFSTLEYRIIEALVQHAKQVTVLLTTDGSHHPFSLFRKSSEVLSHLEDIANRLNINLNKTYFNTFYRYKNDDLENLENGFDALQFTPKHHQNHVKIFESSSMREEINEVARRILKDVREADYKFRTLLYYTVMNRMHIYSSQYFLHMIYHLTLILKIYDTSSHHGNVTFFIRSDTFKLAY